MAEIVVKLVNGELAGKTAQTIAKEVNAAALALKKAEIGTKDWVAANERLDKAKGIQADMKKQIEGTAKASDLLRGAWNKLPGAQFFNQIGESIGMLKGGVGGLISSFGALRVALVGLGIGIILIALTALMSLFKTFTPVIDRVEQIFGGISAVINELWQRFQVFSVGLFKFLTGAPGGLKQMAGAFDGLTDSIKGAYEAGRELAELQQDLDDRNRGIAISNAATAASIDKLILQSKNRTKTEQERLDFLKEAEAIAVAQFEKEKKLAEDNYRAAILMAKQKSRLTEEELLQLAEGTLDQKTEYEKRGTLDDDLLQKITDNKVKLIELEGAVSAQVTKIENARDKINEAREAHLQKLAEQRNKREQDALKEQQAALENIRKLEQEKRLLEIDDEKAREIEKINQAAEEKIVALQGTEAQIFEQIKLIRDMQAMELEAIEQKWENERIKNHDAYLAKLNADSEKWADEQIRIDQQKADFSRQMDQVRRDSAADLSAFVADLLVKDAANEKQARRIKKAAALVEIGLNLIKEKALNAATAAANPLNAVTFGAAGAAQLLLLNQASNLRAGIAAARVLLFGRGGIPSGVLRGPSHAQGGIPLIAEGNEIIMTKGVFQNAGLRAMASAINVAGGGRSFADGGVPMPRSPFGDRPPVASGNAGGSSGNPLADIGDLKNAFMLYAEKVDTWQRQLQVTNNLQETQKGLTTLQQLKAEADV